MDIAALRREYLQGGLRRRDLADDPMDQFERWMEQALAAGLNDPTAMTVASVAADGQPSQRIVLLKAFSAAGFVFYTNLGSRKASELAGNPRVALHFPWHAMERQVKVRGLAERVSTREALAYFLSRPRDSQVSAWASQQSRAVASRGLLMQQFEAMRTKFSNGQVPLPDFWGGFRVVPQHVEFWQGGADRLHDRFEYARDAGGWTIARLSP